jgi:glycolate oxidase FAD binding subunit
MATSRVSNEADVVEVVRAARESNRTLEIVGHGTKRGFGRPVTCADMLDLSDLRGIVTYEPDEMIITARAATPVAEIEAALAEKNQRLGFEPGDCGPLFGAPASSATIGGVLSASCDGSAAVRYGRCRDHLLGFRAVNGFGEAYKGGGKVVKNVTGFDLPKLFCGAMGTLGPLTEVTLRVFPKAQLSQTFAVGNLSPREGLSLLRRVWSSPLESTGLAFHDGTAFIRVEGSRSALDEKIALLRALSAKDLQQMEDGDEIFRNIASGKLIAGAEGSLWRIHVPPASAAQLVSELQPISWCADIAGALFWAVCNSGQPVPAIGRHFGARTISLRGGDHSPPFEPEDPVRAELTRRIKAAFDPLRLFNAGRMWEGV